MKNKHYRQGDVLIERISKLPVNVKPVARQGGRVILAAGEVTGHHHAIAAPNADLYSAVDAGDVTFLEIRDAVAALSHEEHATIPLEPGFYRVSIQREYSPEEIRRVQD